MLFDAMIRESRSVVHQYDRPWVVDASAFIDTFGEIEVTAHEVAVPGDRHLGVLALPVPEAEVGGIVVLACWS